MRFNFLPWRARRDQRRQRRFYGLLLLVGALTGVVQVWVFSNLDSLAEHQAIVIGDQEARLAQQDAILAEWTAKEVTIKEVNQVMEAARALLGTFREARPPVGQWLVDLMAVRPEGVWIERLHIQPHRVNKAPISNQSSTASMHWQVTVSGHAVLEADQMRYQEALASRFGDHREPSFSAVSEGRPIARLTDPSESISRVPVESPGLKSFSIEQWIVSERL